jgi:hypothetical protein
MIVIEQGQIVEEAIWLDRTRSQSCSLPFCTVCFTGESSQAE